MEFKLSERASLVSLWHAGIWLDLSSFACHSPPVDRKHERSSSSWLKRCASISNSSSMWGYNYSMISIVKNKYHEYLHIIYVCRRISDNALSKMEANCLHECDGKSLLEMVETCRRLHLKTADNHRCNQTIIRRMGRQIIAGSYVLSNCLWFWLGNGTAWLTNALLTATQSVASWSNVTTD